MLTFLNAVLTLITLSCALWVWIYEFQRRVTLDTLKNQIQSIRGKLSQQRGIDREKIAEVVDSYLQQRNIEGNAESSSGLEEMILPMLFQNMQGQQGQQQNPQWGESPAPEGSEEAPVSTIGSGGIDGNSER